MGSVWRAEHTSLGTPVAIKLINPELARGQNLLARFHREAQAAAKLRSVHVVQILDHGVDEGVPYIAMECLEGESLAQRLTAERKLTPAATAQVMAGVCRALLRAHRLGIVHRDLKPDNIFLAREETTTIVKVLDFGIAKLLDKSERVDPVAATQAASGATQDAAPDKGLDSSVVERTETGALQGATPNLGPQERTATGAVLGTPRYMSPEQTRGRSDLDGRSDLWALAVIAFECLTGTRTFTAATAGDLILQICSDPIPVPSSIASVPDGFDSWFARATERDPADRFQTVREFADALADALTPGERWLDGERDAGARGTAGVVSRSSDGGSASGGSASGGSASGSSLDPAPISGRSAATEHSVPTVSSSAAPSPVRRMAIGLAVAAVLAGGVFAARTVFRRPSVPAPVASTAPVDASVLAQPDSVLACPVLEAEGVFAPSGWLGAAVAQHVCQRSTWLLAGLSRRTRIPAELLGLSPTPSMEAPLDPFGAPDARERTLQAAKQRASAYVDGRVVRTPGGYEVSLRVIESASGSSSATFEGRGVRLFAATDEALEGLVKAGVIPTQPLDPEVVRVYDIRTASAGWVFDDNVPHEDVDAVCARAAQHVNDLGAAAGTLHDCAGKGGLPKKPPVLAPTTVGTLAMTTLANVGEAEVLAKARPLLEEKLRGETFPAGRVLLIEALAIARSGQSARPEEIEQLMMEALRASPRAVDWPLVMMFSTPQSRVAMARAAHAWNAREPFPAWVNFGLDDAASLPFYRRSWELRSFAGDVLTMYAKAAILTGRREEASALAGACLTGPAPYRPLGEAISARLDIEDGRFLAGQKRLLAAILAIDAYSASDWRAFSPFHTLLLLARVMGNEPSVADPVVSAFVLADPPRAKFTAEDDVLAQTTLLNFCTGASPKIAERCFARFDEWKQQGKLSKSELLASQLAGGRAFVKGDVAAALKAWRPLFRVKGAAILLPFDELLKVEPDLAYDASVGETVTEFLGVPVNAARDAKRAARKGDKEKARAHAELVISKWRDVDVEVPAVAEMERLLKTLK